MVISHLADLGFRIGRVVISVAVIRLARGVRVGCFILRPGKHSELRLGLVTCSLLTSHFSLDEGDCLSLLRIV